MSEILFKSIEEYIQDRIVKNFTYEDFSPDIDINELNEKFKKSFFTNTSFWFEHMPRDSYPGWTFFIELKSYKKISNKTYIGFRYRDSFIHIAAFDKYEDINPGARRFGVNLQFDEIWLNHKVLYDGLIKIFKNALLHANRKDPKKDTLESYRTDWDF